MDGEQQLHLFDIKIKTLKKIATYDGNSPTAEPLYQSENKRKREIGSKKEELNQLNSI